LVVIVAITLWTSGYCCTALQAASWALSLQAGSDMQLSGDISTDFQ
jgi:hypothetical protein